MIIMTFDLSSVCVGVIAAEIDDRSGKTIKMKSCPIMPPQYDATVLGYHKSKKSLPDRKGTMLNTYWKDGETIITKKEKEHRDKEVRSQKDIYVLQNISKTMNYLIDGIKPDLILVEKNAIFNGILTSILLGKVMGSLVSLTGIHGIPLIEYPVNQVRNPFDLPLMIRAFQKLHTPEELMKIPDITKRTLREYLEKIYGPHGVVFQTDDESDACVVYYYWKTEVYNRERGIDSE